MMQKEVLRLVMKNFVILLAKKFPPSGQPSLHDLEARSLLLIETLPAGTGPDVGEVKNLDEAKITKALDWLFVSLGNAFPGDAWALLAVNSLRLHSLEMTSEILSVIVSPPPVVDNKDQAK